MRFSWTMTMTTRTVAGMHRLLLRRLKFHRRRMRARLVCRSVRQQEMDSSARSMGMATAADGTSVEAATKAAISSATAYGTKTITTI